MPHKPMLPMCAALQRPTTVSMNLTCPEAAAVLRPQNSRELDDALSWAEASQDSINIWLANGTFNFKRPYVITKAVCIQVLHAGPWQRSIGGLVMCIVCGSIDLQASNWEDRPTIIAADSSRHFLLAGPEAKLVTIGVIIQGKGPDGYGG